MRRNTPAAGAGIGWNEEKDGNGKAQSPAKDPAVPLRPVPAKQQADAKAVAPVAKRRVQFDFSEEAYQRLEKLRARTQKQSQAEVVRNSLRVYEWLLDQIDKGYALQLAKDDLVKEVELLL